MSPAPATSARRVPDGAEKGLLETTAGARLTLAALTMRGRSFLAAGGTAVVSALILGQRDLLRVGVLLTVLPLGALMVTSRYHYRLQLRRTISPARVVAGTTARVRLELANLTRLSTRVLLAEDRVPYALGPSPRFVLARLPGGRRAAVTYTLRSEIRGRYTLGPLRMLVTDPFGMCEVTRTFAGTDQLVVVPRTYPLGPAGGGGQWAGAGESVSRSAAAAGEDDIATREYRYGDDLRRVHWRSTARRGELMVRRDEQPRQMRATVLLDARANGHRGDGPASSFEWAVSAAASVAVHLSSQRYGVRLLRDDRLARYASAGDAEGAGPLLEDLAVATLGGSTELSDAITTLTRSGGDGIVVAVLGDVSSEDVRALATLSRGTRGVAIVLRTSQWSGGAPDRAAAALDDAREKNLVALRTAGWGVAEADVTDSIPDVWARATGTAPSPRPRMVVLPSGGDS